MSDVRNPAQFFHASAADFAPGTVLRPGNELGKATFGGISDNEPWRGDHVWMTDDLRQAREWAYTMGEDVGKSAHVYDVTPGPGTKKLHDAVPRDHLDPEDDTPDQHVGPSAVVRRRLS